MLTSDDHEEPHFDVIKALEERFSENPFVNEATEPKSMR
jgi:hypothetical protein